MPRSALPPYVRIVPHSTLERAYWRRVQRAPRLREFLNGIAEAVAAAPAQPPLPAASDFLAAKRHNDRSRVDKLWQSDRGTLSALALNRALKGLDPKDPDDRLLDWLWGTATQPTWTISAHLPDRDLPAGGQPTLDLASCEMAALLAEAREVLKPWMDSVSKTLADTLLYEIDTRILTPYGEGLNVWWQDASRRYLNNWLGVCAGSILAACESLAAQGHPRPKARARALAGLRKFVDAGFTPGGECDEGVGYWSYGVSFATLGWSRLSQRELAANVDMQRLRLVAEYPRRVHLFDDYFFSGNDGPLRARASHIFVPWLAAAVRSEWLAQWAARAPAAPTRHFGMLLRLLDAPVLAQRRERRERGEQKKNISFSARSASSTVNAQLLEDQQVAILRTPTPKGELLACLSGGNNGERHNHNDLGHFIVTFGKQLIVPDLGAPHYTADFFGPRRYTYLAASSRGHCCPLIGKHEQRDGPEAAGRILEWRPSGATPSLLLELAEAYPSKAGLLTWQRRLTSRLAHRGERRERGERINKCLNSASSASSALKSAPAAMVLEDLWRTRRAETITHVIWSLEKPRVQRAASGVARLALGPLVCELSPVPAKLSVEAVDLKPHRIGHFGERMLYRIAASYRARAKTELRVATTFTAQG